MTIDDLVSALGRNKADLLEKMTEKGMDKRGLEMFFNHNVVAVRFRRGTSDVATWCCSSTPLIHMFNASVDAQFRKDPDDLPKINRDGLILKRRDVLKTWNLLGNKYCDIPLDRNFAILNFEEIDSGNADSLQKVSERLASYMKAGFEEVRS